jgi:hypothetical protein
MPEIPEGIILHTNGGHCRLGKGSRARHHAVRILDARHPSGNNKWHHILGMKANHGSQYTSPLSNARRQTGLTIYPLVEFKANRWQGFHLEI